MNTKTVKIWRCYDLEGLGGSPEGADWEHQFVTGPSIDGKKIKDLFRILGVSEVFMDLYLDNAQHLCYADVDGDFSTESGSQYITTTVVDYED